MNRRSGVKMFLSIITAPKGNAGWTPPKIREFSVVWIFILQIFYASFIQEINYGSANTYGLVNVHILIIGNADRRGEMVNKWQDIAY